MKFLVIGLGSMGKRRVRCLKALGYSEICGFDPREDRRSEASEKFGIKVFNSVEEAFEYRPVAAIISTPPDKHMVYALMCADKGIHFFTEASVVDDEMSKLIDVLKEKKGLVGAPSCTMRYYPAVRLIRKLAEENAAGRISTFTFHSGQYLPDWHPWEKISDFYVSKRETGGCREIFPFELCWLSWIFGSVTEVCGINGKTIDLDADIDDVYQAIVRFESGLFGHILIDVVSRNATRRLTLIGDKGTVEWDWNEGAVKLYNAEKGGWERLEYSVGQAESGYNKNIYEEMYIDELNSFIKAVKGSGDYGYTYEEDLQILNVLYTLEKSRLAAVNNSRL